MMWCILYSAKMVTRSKEQNGQQGQALHLGQDRGFVTPGLCLCCWFFRGGHDILTQKVIEPGDNHPQKKGEHDGEGKGHKDVFFPGERGVDPVVFIVRGPQGDHDKNDDLQDADELQVIEKKFFAVGPGEI